MCQRDGDSEIASVCCRCPRITFLNQNLLQYAIDDDDWWKDNIDRSNFSFLSYVLEHVGDHLKHAVHSRDECIDTCGELESFVVALQSEPASYSAIFLHKWLAGHQYGSIPVEFEKLRVFLDRVSYPLAFRGVRSQREILSAPLRGSLRDAAAAGRTETVGQLLRNSLPQVGEDELEKASLHCGFPFPRALFRA